MASTLLRVEQYIDATRLSCKSRLNRDWYEQFYFSKIRLLAQSVELPIELVLTYSATRRAEQLHIDGSNWLVYDQYMGQTMNLLNRIFIESEGMDAGVAYLHKLLGEMFLEAGKFSAAMHCARFYARNSDELAPKHLDEGLRGLFTTCQELFYQFHEMGHLAIHLDHGYVESVRDQAVDLLQDIQESYLRVDPSKPEAGDDLHEEFLRIRGEALGSAQLFEEIFCDTWAADGVLYLPIVTDDQFFDALRAMYIGFYHLQAIAYVEGLVNHRDDEERRLRRFAEVQVRSHCLRRHLIFHYAFTRKSGSPEEDEKREERITQQLIQDQTRYYESIFDTFMQVGSAATEKGEFDRFVADTLEELESLPHFAELSEIDKQLEIAEITRAMTGWPSLSTFV